MPYFYKEWVEDPKMNKNMSIRQYLDLYRHTCDLIDNPQQVKDIATPILFTQGGCDTVVDNSQAMRVYQHLTVRDKNRIEYDELSHYALADGEWNRVVIMDNVAWMNTHI